MASSKSFHRVCPRTTEDPIPPAQQGLEQSTRTHFPPSWSAPWRRISPCRYQWHHGTQALKLRYLEEKPFTIYHGGIFTFNDTRCPATRHGYQRSLAPAGADDTATRPIKGFDTANNSPVSADTFRFRRRDANSFKIAAHSSSRDTERGIRLFRSQIARRFYILHHTWR